jgi:hypothetical protein
MSFERDVSFIMMENQCINLTSEVSSVSKEIERFYLNQQELYPQNFFYLSPRSYNYENPLVLSLENMKLSLDQMKNHSNLSQNAEELYHLYNSSRRYEDQKCSFKHLAENKKKDLRPYLNFAHDCTKKYKNELCDESEYIGMSADKAKWTKSNLLELCRAFSNDVNCQSEYILNQKNGSLGAMIQKYYLKFQTEQFLALFQLRPSHLKYNCQASGDKIVMVIKIMDGPLDHDYLESLLLFVEKVWSNKNFSLKFELVKNHTSEVIEILPSNKGISYVPDFNNRLVYLSTQLEFQTAQRVLAHEMGHVLGFPDCYIEFFDDSKKELVYYEISKSNFNIMCSLKEGVQVPEDYFVQIAENSCLFNEK